MPIPPPTARYHDEARGVPQATGGRALDLSCGTGRHAVALAERFRRFLAATHTELTRNRLDAPMLAAKDVNP
jgi:ubiquinone/menaquinone biosynthesis C-methylase UbiE